MHRVRHDVVADGAVDGADAPARTVDRRLTLAVSTGHHRTPQTMVTKMMETTSETVLPDDGH